MHVKMGLESKLMVSLLLHNSGVITYIHTFVIFMVRIFKNCKKISILQK